MRVILMCFALFLAGCAQTNEPIVIRSPKSALGTPPGMPAVATPSRPVELEGIKYYMISELDVAKYVELVNQLKKQNAAKTSTFNAKVVNNEVVAGAGEPMVNDFLLNKPVIGIDDLVTLPVIAAAPIEPQKVADWTWGGYIATVLFVFGIALLSYAYNKRKKEMAQHAKEVHELLRKSEIKA